MVERKNFGQLKEVLAVPDLIDIQLASYTQFLQANIQTDDRENRGLQEVFKEIFPIESRDGSYVLDFVFYEVGEPKEALVDCLKDGKTYAAPLYVTFRLKAGKDIKQERVFMGEIPIMTGSGSFVINGAERVIVSQLHRSPGICFEKEKHASGRDLFSYRIIPDHGSWLEVQFDINDLIYIYFDRRRRRRKFLITTLLRAIGYGTDSELLDAIYGVQNIPVSKVLKFDNLPNYYVVEDILDPNGSEDDILVRKFESLNPQNVKLLKDSGLKQVKLVDTCLLGDSFIRCLQRDSAQTVEEALKEIHRRMRPGDPPNVQNARSLLKRMFFEQRRYDLGYVGRYKINQKLKTNIAEDVRTLEKEDFVAATAYLMRLRHGDKDCFIDDIDHLGNRRVRTVGELLQNQCRIGLARIERLVGDRLMQINENDLSPSKLINAKAFSGVIRDFFGRNQLSQFMDQTNSLSELTNKRRLSALGPGGLSRERAGFEVRDIHPSHYGRVCPIETPEGPNIGLISSLALYARINNYGFIETPYRKVIDGVVTDQVEYLSADKEDGFIIAQANAALDDKGHFVKEYVLGRCRGDYKEFLSKDVSYMDVSPKQLVSGAAGLIPFLENDDANRALMGSNMQRQAVPLLKSDSPYVGTGLEKEVARGSRAVLLAQNDGIVAAVDAERIIVTETGAMPEENEVYDNYVLWKYMRSNASTYINQRPLVRKGDVVKRGDVLADGASTQGGELALGRNVMVAFMPWCGYNFEDAIILSEKLVMNDVYTSVHVSSYDVIARDTKLGPEEITRDIPNLGEEALRNLDSEGIVRIGTEVVPGDILVGKITPKSETELDPEERLLRAIFMEKAANVKDSSLYVPSGADGVVMDVRIERKFDPTKQGKVSKRELQKQLRDLEANYANEHAEIIDEMTDKLSGELCGCKMPIEIFNVKSGSEALEVIIPCDKKVTKAMLKRLAECFDTYKMAHGAAKTQIEAIMKGYRVRLRDLKLRYDETFSRIERGEGNEGVIKSVKVYIASKRRIQVGDKMAGRHGNKGIVSNIVPVSDLPYLGDGTPVEIILNPLGVPSRMNVGQVLETHLGYAARILGYKVATPVFDGAQEDSIWSMLEAARKKRAEQEGWNYNEETHEITDRFGRDRSTDFVDGSGKAILYDGRTGERFAQRITVGLIYMLKLDHLVVNKIHVRSVGAYSLITQQPLGGKAQHGGQRFGEMEVWALEAYGAAYTLQEMLTVKSDDVNGRTKIYSSIMHGDCTLVADLPESFNVLMKEMQSLCLDVRVRRDQNA